MSRTGWNYRRDHERAYALQACRHGSRSDHHPDCVGDLVSVVTALFKRRDARRSPDYEIVATVRGYSRPDGQVYWDVYIDGEGNCDEAADILERAIEVLRDKEL